MNFVRIFICAAVLSSWACAAENHTALTDLGKLKAGLTRAEVTALLGEPHATGQTQDGRVSTYYRLALLKGAGATSDTMLLADAIRCDFENDVLSRVAGLWPKPERPAAGTPREKIMLVDSSSIYDRIALTRSCNAVLTRERDKYDSLVQAANADGEKLVAAYTAAVKERDRAKSKTPEKTAAELKASELLTQIATKQTSIKDYVASAQKRLERELLEYRVAHLPQISDALLAYQKAHGYLYVYEIKNNVFSPGKKPMFVSGVDVTDDVVKWIDSGGAVEFGLILPPEKQSSAQE